MKKLILLLFCSFGFAQVTPVVHPGTTNTVPYYKTPTSVVPGATPTMIGLGNVTNNAQTQASVVPNTAPSSGQLLIGNAGGTAYAPQTLSGSCTITNTGVITCSSSGVSSVSGTANQIAVATGTTTPVISIPATFIAPGTISAVTSIDATKLLGNLPALNGSALTNLPSTISGLTTGSIPKASSSTAIANSLCDEGITTANTLTCTDTAGIAAPRFIGTGSGAGYVQLGQGTAPSLGTTAISLYAPTSVTSYGIVLPGAAASGISRWANSSGTVTQSISELSGDATTSGSNALTLATVNSNVGSFTSANITVNAKGLITAAANGSGGSGTVTSFSAGTLSPLFTTSVATSTTTPALTFSLSNAAASTVFGNATTGSAAPGFTTNPIVTSIGTGTPPTCTAGTGGALCQGEGTAATAVSAVDDLHADSTQHAEMVNNNNTGEMALSRTLCVNVTPVTVAANVTTDQNLQACSLNANTLNVVGRTLRVDVSGVFSTAAASVASLTFKVKLCTVSGCGSGTVIAPITTVTGATAALTASNLSFSQKSIISTQTAGSSSAYEAHGQLTIDLSSTAATPDSVYGDTNTATVGTIDSTGALFLQVTVAASAGSTSNSFTERQLVVEVLN